MSSNSWPDLAAGWDRLSDAVADSVDSVAASLHEASNSALKYSEELATVLGQRIDQLKPVAVPQPPPVQPSFLSKFGRRVATVLALGAVGAAVYILVVAPRRRKPRRRFARTAPDGGRSEVVLLVCSPSEPLSAIIAQDLNIRGFIVYMTTTSAEHEYVTAEKSPDIRPLLMDSLDRNSVAAAMAEMDRIIKTPVASLVGATPHRLTLTAVMILPDLQYPVGPLETTAPYAVVQTVHSKILAPLTVLTGGLIDLVRRSGSRIILVTPSIMGSLTPGFHAWESLSTAALSALSLSLSRELRPLGIPLTHVKMGSFDTGHSSRSHQQQIVKNMRADILAWPDTVRPYYASAYAASAYLQTNRTRGSRLGLLHHTLFDVLTMHNPPRVVHVGRGSCLYEQLAAWVPERVMTLVLATAANAPDDFGSRL